MIEKEVGAIQFIQPSVDMKSLQQPDMAVDFGAWLSREVDSVNQQVQLANSNVRKLALGETDNLHQVMLSLSKAKLQFELVLQVRNKLLEGYQEVMRMQV